MESIIKRLAENRKLNESYGTNAWHLRQDGKAFPVKVHMYCEGDEDLSSEAEVAAFIIKSNSKDIDLAKDILTAWMVLLIEDNIAYDDESEDLLNHTREALHHLPFKFQYEISEQELLDIFSSHKFDVDTYYEYLDSVKERLEDLQESIKKSINNQFCRVRYGGKYDTSKGDSEIWFRISSEGYNWANTIYLFVSDMKKKLSLSHITICRDNESDDSDVDYFYKAKDGTKYYHMPIEEYLAEDHEHSPVFDSINLGSGILNSTWRLLKEGYTYHEIESILLKEGATYSRDHRKYFLKKERRKYCEKE